MAGVNKVIIVGNLGQDPEVRYTQSGSAVANFSVATSETFTDKAGEKQERTEWHRIVAWGKTAELCGEYLQKGRQVYLEGKLQTRQWDDKEGQKRYTTEIIAQQVTFLGGRGERGDAPREGAPQGGFNNAPAHAGGQDAPRRPPPPPQAAASNRAPAPQASADKSFDYGPPPMSDDDIPF